ncbi:MAG: hypothetical protein OXI53_05850 [Nitrospira sp.]|nr:hypothetical protein [Nitrospira sp.]MDE0404816.1 hypothetical protein [Nitrospira sp.]MDE0486620.1 hypothetical protein [Nitrospira sp.]
MEEQLQEELAFFNEQLATLLEKHRYHFALIKRRELKGTFTTFEEAYEKGVTEFGNVNFLVKQILDKEPIEHIPALTYGLMSASF